MAAALHGADFPKARQLRDQMSPQTLGDFAKKADFRDVKGGGSSTTKAKPKAKLPEPVTQIQTIKSAMKRISGG